MGSKDELRSQVIQLLKAMSEGENILQCIKEALILHENFSPVALFQRISKDKQKMVKADIVNFLEEHSVQFNDEEVREYMANNNLGKQISFGDFLDSIMPFNADALRTYKDNYLAKLSIRDQDDEVQYIFRELMENELKLVRVLHQIKTEILVNSKANIKKVTNLIKTDLIERSKVREGRKFEEKFENNDDVSFIDLRRFLELWTPTHQVMLLNLMRFLRSENPLKPINLKLYTTLKHSKSFRSLSANRGIGSPSKAKGSATKVNQNNAKNVDLLSRSRKKPDDERKNIYDEYKREVEREFLRDINTNPKEKSERDNARSLEKKNREVMESELVRRSRYQREKKGIDGTLISKLFETIVNREERLQKLRKKLFKSKDFNLVNLFRMVDTRGGGIVNAADIRSFVNNVYQSDLGDCKLLIMRFAKERGILRFNEFCDIFRPLSKELNLNVNARSEKQIMNPYRSETNRLICEILRTTLDMELEIYEIKKMINDKGQDVRDLFRYLDLDEKGYLDPEDIKVVLEEGQFFCDLKDMKLILRHFYKKMEDRIQFSDFKQFVEI